MAEPAESPPAKRARTIAGVDEQAADVCKSLSNAQVQGPAGGASLKELLLLLAPAALKENKRQASDDVLLRVIGETFDGEEGRLQAELEKAEQLMVGVEAQQEKLDGAEAAAADTLKEKVAEVDASLQKFDALIQRQYEAEKNLRASALRLFEKEAQVSQDTKAVKALKEGAWENVFEQQCLLGRVQDVLSKARKENCLVWEAVADALVKKPSNRAAFDHIVVEAAEAACQSYTKDSEARVAEYKAIALAADGHGAPGAAGVEGMLQLQEALENARALRRMTNDKREVVEKLKAGLPEPESKGAELQRGAELSKLQKCLEQLAQRVEADDSLRDGIASALLKEPSARGDYDGVVVREFEAALDRHLAKLSDGLPERVRALEAAEHAFLQYVKPAIVDAQNEAARRSSDRETVLKERDALANFVEEKYEPLKKHKFENLQERRPLLMALSRMLRRSWCNLEEGFVTSLPMVLKKTPEERTAFEQALLKQVEESWEQHREVLDGRVMFLDKDLAETCAETEATATDEAWTAEKAVQKEQQELLGALRIFEEMKREASLSLEVKQEAARNYKTSTATAGQTRAEAQEFLEQLHSAKESLAALKSRAKAESPAAC